MIAARSFAKQTVGMFGLARSTAVSARALIAGGANLFAWDDEESARNAAAKEGASVSPFGEWPWARIRAVVVEPAIAQTHPVLLAAQTAGVQTVGELELFAREIRPLRNARGRAPVIAVTGNDVRSTTAAVIGHILSSCGFTAEVGGAADRPVLDFAAPGARSAYVLDIPRGRIEVSPGLYPDVTVLTGIASDCLPPEMAIATGLLERTANDGQVCIGVDDARAASIYTRLSVGDIEAVPVSIGKVLGRGIFAIDGALYDAQGQRATKVMDLSAAAHLAGVQEWQSAALAYAATKKLAKDSRAIARAIASFPGLTHQPAHIAPERQAS
jgi:UDP-N-acetylmuramoylalanine--D-glutamate ligase